MSDDADFDRLIEGYKTFHAHYFEQSTLYKQLVQEGQKPTTLVIACCDSRVDPAIMTDSQPGELFVVRNVANLVPPFDKNPQYHGTSAAIEFAVKQLDVQHIIILGHSHCGGIRALMQTPLGQSRDDMPSDFIHDWMRIAQPAKQNIVTQHPTETLDQQAHHCEKASLRISLDNLHTFPWVHERVTQGRLSLHGWYFDLATGSLETYQSETDQFIPLG